MGRADVLTVLRVGFKVFAVEGIAAWYCRMQLVPCGAEEGKLSANVSEGRLLESGAAGDMVEDVMKDLAPVYNPDTEQKVKGWTDGPGLA